MPPIRNCMPSCSSSSSSSPAVPVRAPAAPSRIPPYADPRLPLLGAAVAGAAGAPKLPNIECIVPGFAAAVIGVLSSDILGAENAAKLDTTLRLGDEGDVLGAPDVDEGDEVVPAVCSGLAVVARGGTTGAERYGERP